MKRKRFFFFNEFPSGFGCAGPALFGVPLDTGVSRCGSFIQSESQSSFRDVEELMSSRGVSLTYETVREWCLKFGQTYAKGLRRRSPRPGDRWHLDEVFLKINGRLHYLWRAVDLPKETLQEMLTDAEAAAKKKA